MSSIADTKNFAADFRARMFARDLAHAMALRDTRKRENAEVRARCMADKELVALLQSEAQRRGEVLNWAEYFRNIDIAA